MPAVPKFYCLTRSAPYWSNPPVLIFDIWALWRLGLGARVPKCQKSKLVGLTCMTKCKALVGLEVKGLMLFCRNFCKKDKFGYLDPILGKLEVTHDLG